MERDPDGLAKSTPGSISFHRATDAARRGDSHPHSRSVVLERTEGEQFVVARDAFCPNTRDIFPSPQSGGVHHFVARRR
jgi:hypothetical protein